MKIFVMTDLEGISGINSIDMIKADSDGYQRAREDYWGEDLTRLEDEINKYM